MKISIIIPVYNEEKTVKMVIEKVKKLKLPRRFKKEIIVVDDGSSDKSFEIIKSIRGVKVLGHEKNRGKGAAIKTALKNLSGDYLIVQDADLELDPGEILKLLEVVTEKKAKVVYGSRNLFGRGERSVLFYSGGKLITSITNLLYSTNLTDEPCGFKLFKTDVLREIRINEERFGWEPEVTAKITKKGIKIYEVPVVAYTRSIKQGKKLRRRDGLRAFWVLVKYKLKD